MLPTIEQVAADLAADFAEYSPDARVVCASCGQQVEPGTITCPLCKLVMPLRVMMDALRYRRQDRLDYPPPVQPEDDKEEPPDAVQPPGLDDVIGNADAVLQIRTALDAHRERAKAAGKAKGPAFPHLLLSGPGGTGKTMLAEIVACELKAKLRLQMGQVLSTPAKVAEVLLGMKRGDVLFIDEIHGLKTQCQEALYRAMEDRLLVPATGTGKPLGAPVRLPAFTIIGATTDEWGLLPSLCQRFEHVVRMSRLTPAELSAAIGGRAERMHLSITPEALDLIGCRALGTPRLAVRLLKGCSEVADAQKQSEITADIVGITCEIWGIDSLGLDKVARAYLRVLSVSCPDAVRLNVLATKLDGLSRRTVETKVEPDLVWLGLVTKDADGRRLLPKGREHLAKEKR